MQPGDAALLRTLQRGRVRWALPHGLVEETPRHVALYAAPGFRRVRPVRFAADYLRAPLRRARLGWDTADHALDVVVTPDGSWRWKDEHHLALLEERDFYSATEAAAIRAEGERVVACLAELLPTGWENWRPDPNWPVPSLPSDWDRL